MISVVKFISIYGVDVVLVMQGIFQIFIVGVEF